MVAKKHKKGRPSSSIDRKRIELLLEKGIVKRRIKIGTHRINYFNDEEE
tara:strand:+ start:293 stop:439 length:147 start_codon:yes stop_codon:yes gene_type:complete